MRKIKKTSKLSVNREVLVSDLRSARGAAIASDDASCTGPCSGMCGTDSCGGSCGCTMWTSMCTTITIVPCVPV